MCIGFSRFIRYPSFKSQATHPLHKTWMTRRAGIRDQQVFNITPHHHSRNIELQEQESDTFFSCSWLLSWLLSGKYTLSSPTPRVVRCPIVATTNKYDGYILPSQRYSTHRPTKPWDSINSSGSFIMEESFRLWTFSRLSHLWWTEGGKKNPKGYQWSHSLSFPQCDYGSFRCRKDYSVTVSLWNFFN